MKARRPDLIVPIRDRRQHKRYLTLKNVRNVMLGLLAAFLIVTIHGETRGLKPGEHGRLFHKELPEAPKARPVEIVRQQTPEPVPDAVSADPTLIEPMARAQWLDDDFYGAHSEPTRASTITAPTVHARVERDARIAIVGGAEGIAVVKELRRRPVLSGGFGR